MINIRSASIGDFEKVLILVRKATQDMEARGIHQWDDLYPDESTLRADIDQKYMYVAEIDGCTAGMIVLNEDQPREYGDIRWQYSGRAMVVHRLTIDPKYQRQKIATQLMIFAEQLAAEVDCVTIRLDAFTENPGATALYDSLEYQKAGSVRFRKGMFFCYERPVTRTRQDRR